ncbi:hypothetical protein SK128_016046 [Halocaridina rubra]|uniref:Calponin-homology (CH) domain-containing protein n=1 Tax=Halocaridina rubra TaxID=373956 RepID=A0AAN8WRP7_HALRR
MVVQEDGSKGPLVVKSDDFGEHGWFWWVWWPWAAWLSLWERWQPFLALAWMYISTVFISNTRQEQLLKEWLKKEVPNHPIEDLAHDLADGVILCGLMEALLPGTCPRHDLLSRDQPSANLRLASRLAFSFLSVTQVSYSHMSVSCTRISSIKYITPLWF